MPVLDAIQKKEEMKIGRRKVAEILTHKSGVEILVVNRTRKDYVRGRGNKMITHGIREDQGGWPIESTILSRLKRRGIPLIAVRVRDDKSVYMSRMSDWLAHSEVYTRRKRNGSVQRTLSHSHWHEKSGKIKI